MNYSDHIHPDFKMAKHMSVPFNSSGIKWMNRAYKSKCKRIVKKKGIESYHATSDDGSKIELLVVRPEGISNTDQSLPGLLYFHGGGFFLDLSGGSLKQLMHYANEVQCVVIAVKYRLLPDYPFPKAFQDGFASLLHVYEHASELGIDSERLAVLGDSAGGNLAAAVALKARDYGKPTLKFQMLIYPVTDYRQTSESMGKYSDAPIWTQANNNKMWKAYLSSGKDEMIGYASPLMADSCENLPNAYIEVAELDCLRDEGIAYGDKLKEANNWVELYEIEGGVHGFDQIPFSEVVNKVMKRRFEWMTDNFNKEG